MKKSLFALAAVTAFAGAAQAQSSVTVYGIIDMSYSSFTNKTTAASGAVTSATGRTTGNGDGALSTSRLGFRGVEDMGGGKTAEFVLEYDLVDVGSGANVFGARQSFIGIGDKALGSLRLGRQFDSNYNALVVGLAGQGNNMPGSVYSAGLAGKSTNSSSVRPVQIFVDNAVTYTSPSLKGAQLQVQGGSSSTSTSDVAPAVSDSFAAGSLTYTGVKNLAVALGLYTAYATNTSTKNSASTLAANYNFGVAQAFANYTMRKTEVVGVTQRDQKATEIGVRVPVTPVIGVWASGFMGNNGGVNSTAAITAITGNTDIGGFQLGTTYSMSKRTTLYGIFGQQYVKGQGLASPQEIQTQAYAVGLRHSF
jgi:predicted porin